MSANIPKPKPAPTPFVEVSSLPYNYRSLLLRGVLVLEQVSNLYQRRSLKCKEVYSLAQIVVTGSKKTDNTSPGSDDLPGKFSSGILSICTKP